MFGNIWSKRSLVNQLEMPSPGWMSHAGPVAVQTFPPIGVDVVALGVLGAAVLRRVVDAAVVC